ncbi:MAG: flagellar type III secretion system protein FlhB [Pelagimonas sp.]|jgi:flagellar biosynthetic protein FlhB|nr:flagellar type III secretion system protein FlhB [Pelagimonas sp.]
MAEQDDSAEKSHEPSQRKLDEARKKGEIPRSTDLLTFMAYTGLLVIGTSFGGQAMLNFGEVLLPLLEQPDRLDRLFSEDGSQGIVGGLMSSALAAVLPVLIAPGVFVLLTLFATRGIVFAATKLKPKINKISPIDNAKNKYGRRGLFEFFKSFLKLALYSILLAFFLRNQLETIVGTVQATPAQIILMMTDLMMRFLFIVVLIAAALGAGDYFWQRNEHMRKNRMSQKELKDEMKESEGDPHLKQHRRMRAQEMALNQMLTDVPDADVVIVNPTHYAVALKWSRMPGTAPECVAKGVDEIAARIREAATDAEVPIHSDPPTARALYATTEIGQEILVEHYQPVAAAIRFADEMRVKARQKGWT